MKTNQNNHMGICKNNKGKENGDIAMDTRRRLVNKNDEKQLFYKGFK